MNKYERSLAAVDELFASTSPEEFERDYLKAEGNIGIRIKDYLSLKPTTKSISGTDFSNDGQRRHNG